MAPDSIIRMQTKVFDMENRVHLQILKNYDLFETDASVGHSKLRYLSTYFKDYRDQWTGPSGTICLNFKPFILLPSFFLADLPSPFTVNGIFGSLFLSLSNSFNQK